MTIKDKIKFAKEISENPGDDYLLRSIRHWIADGLQHIERGDSISGDLDCKLKWSDGSPVRLFSNECPLCQINMDKCHECILSESKICSKEYVDFLWNPCKENILKIIFKMVYVWLINNI